MFIKPISKLQFRLSVLALALALLLAACSANVEPNPGSGDESTTPAVTGIITDVDGKPLADVGVAVKEGTVATPEKLMLTDADGKYSWDLPVGTYKLAASKDGYAEQVLEVVVKAEGQQVELNFKLDKAP
jgi:hypothetical protein